MKIAPVPCGEALDRKAFHAPSAARIAKLQSIRISLFPIAPFGKCALEVEAVLVAALRILVAIDDERGLFDREADEDGYSSEELASAHDVVRTAVEQ